MQSYDVVIAGGGMSGFLAAAHLAAQKSGASIHLIEAEKQCGGRLRSSRRESQRWGFGNNMISKELAAFLTETMTRIYPQWSMSQYLIQDLSEVGFCSGGKITKFSYSDILRSAGFKAMGGRAAAKEWSEAQEQVLSGAKPQFDSVSKALSIKRNGASGTVLSQVGKAIGVPDIWSAPLELLKSKFQISDAENDPRDSSAESTQLITGYFDDLIDDSLELLQHDGFISLARQCRLLEVKQEENFWLLQTEKGPVRARELIMAIDPWSALSAMTREIMPVCVSNMALKAKPVSIVTLSSQMVSGDLNSNFLIIASEDVQIVKHGDSLTFQATIDYEMSLDAPEVVKAVKRLKRAAKKLPQYAPGLEIKGEFVALVPVAWSQPTASQDHKFVEKMSKSHANALQFIGDAYGSSYNGDKNIIAGVSGIKISHQIGLNLPSDRVEFTAEI